MSSAEIIRETCGRNGPVLRSLALLSLATIAAILVFTPPAVAQVVSPLQAGHYNPGMSNVRDMAHPPAGLFVLWYNGYSSSSSYIDQNGNKFESVNLSDLDDRLPDIDVDLQLKGFATVPSIFYASEFRLLGGARYMAGVAPNYVSADVAFNTRRPSLIDPDQVITRELGGKASGFSDLMVVPLGLSWGKEKFDLTTLYAFYAPTGKYETGAEDNMGLGFWTHQLQAFGYYYPKPDKGTALMLGLTYEMNGTIKDADVKPGNRFTLEWGLSQYLSERFEVTVQGGHNWQITDDSGADVFYDPSPHDRKSTFVVGGSYWVWQDRMTISAKYGFDAGVRQRFQNNTFYLNVMFLTNLLTGE